MISLFQHLRFQIYWHEVFPNYGLIFFVRSVSLPCIHTCTHIQAYTQTHSVFIYLQFDFFSTCPTLGLSGIFQQLLLRREVSHGEGNEVRISGSPMLWSRATLYALHCVSSTAGILCPCLCLRMQVLLMRRDA